MTFGAFFSLRTGSLPQLTKRGSVIAIFVWCMLTPALFVSSCLPGFDYGPTATGGNGNGDGDIGTDNGDGDTGDGDTANGGVPGTTGGDGDGDVEVADHCKNREVDKGETDTDCGGLDCPGCRLGQECDAGADCAKEECTGGICQAPSCEDKVKTSPETDTDCGGNCPPCAVNLRCKVAADCESGVCNDTRCAAPTCEDRVRNQGELDVDCGGPCGLCDVGQNCVLNVDCIQPTEAESEARCENKTCALDCNTGTGDCDQKAATGCEANLNIDAQNCGECDLECDLPNVQTAACAGGRCEIDFGTGESDQGCDAGFSDCNGDPADGCEAHLETDLKNCGACDTVCSTSNGAPSCETGLCKIDCEPKFADCDSDATSNGCETDLLNSVLNCGGCGASFACDAGSSGQSPNCNAGDCEYIGCPDGYGACGGDMACDDLLSSLSNCGTCGEICAAANGSAACSNNGSMYGCGVSSCASGFGDCDGSYTNGCETNTTTSKTHCGACNNQGGNNCLTIESTVNLRVAQATCSGGGCLITSCDAGFADCDLNPSNGCEVNLSNNSARCGGCLPTDNRPQNGVNCGSAWTNADGSCNNSGICVFDDCDNNFDSCNSTLNDGCEVNLSNNAANCGLCATNCGGTSDTNVSGTPACANSACSVSCSAGYCPNLSDPERKCNQLLGTVSNCASCGNVCAGTNPFCEGSCKQRFPVQVINTWEGFATSGNTATINFSLTNGSGSNRAVVVLVAYGQGPAVVKYGTTDMLLAVSQKAASQPGYAAIYYLLDASLGNAGSKTVTINGTWGGIVARVIELSKVAQSAPGSTNKAETSGNCPVNNTVSATVTQQGSLIVGALLAEGNSAASGAHTGFSTELSEIFETEATTGMLGYLNNANSTTTVGWNNISTCWATALTTATFGPLITGP